jgi:hypothetical protein
LFAKSDSEDEEKWVYHEIIIAGINAEGTADKSDSELRNCSLFQHAGRTGGTLLGKASLLQLEWWCCTW